MEILLDLVVLTVPFALLALLAHRYGAESRPVFDGRPRRDGDRPNWPPYWRENQGPGT